VFSHQDGAANRVLANVEHEEGIRGIVGHGLNLIERSDGFYGSFKMHETPEGEKALMLIREGVFSGVSVEAKPRKSQRTVDGLVRRVKADLVNIAFTRFHAYKRAGVLAVREEADTFEIVDEALQPLGMKPELIERCRSLGIEMPQRYQAHPEQTDTSADADTSEAGTRQTDANTTNTEES
jgi:HK97 family phage prohead protease